jgi:hypothetical protein
MSDIRFNNWKHQSGTGGVVQDSGGQVGIGSTIPHATLNVGGDGVFTGIVTASSFSGSWTGSTGSFTGDVTIDGDLGVGGTITYEDVARVDATGISTFREGFKVGPLAGIAATYYTDGSVRTTGIVTAASFYGDGANLSNLPASAPVGGATTNKVFFNNDQTVWNSYTIPANTNSGTFGPILVAAGQTVTIPSGSYWTIV